MTHSTAQESPEAGPLTVLPAAPRRPSVARRWIPLGIGLLAFLIALGAGLLVTVDWGVRNAEMRRLVTAVEASEAAMGDTQAAVADAFDAFDASDGGQAAKMELDSTLTAAADEGRRQIAAAAGPIAAVRVLPWHHDLAKARDAYLAHNRAWQDYLARATDDPAEFDAEQTEVNDTFMAVEPLMRAALPDPPLFDLGRRVDAIFAPPPTADENLQST